MIHVQTHFIDPDALGPASRSAAGRVPQNGGRHARGSGVDPRLIDAAEWATLVFGTSETAVALLTSTPGSVADNVLTNPQIAAARDIMARYGAAGRVLTHTIVHPNLGPAELEQWRSGATISRLRAGRCTPSTGRRQRPPRPGGGSSMTRRSACPFSSRCGRSVRRWWPPTKDWGAHS